MRKVTEPVGAATAPMDADFTTVVKLTESPAEGVVRDDVRLTVEFALTTVIETVEELLLLKSGLPL